MAGKPPRPIHSLHWLCEKPKRWFGRGRNGGQKKDLLELIESIECKMDGYWQDKTMDERSSDAHFDEFSIRNHSELLHDGTKKPPMRRLFKRCSKGD